MASTILVKKAYIGKKFNKFTNEFDYLLALSKEQFDIFKSIGLNVKEIKCLDTKEYWIKVRPKARIGHEEETPTEDDFLFREDIDIEFIIYTYNTKYAERPEIKILLFDKNCIKKED